MKTEKLLGVDYGDVRTGLALSDAAGWMAHGAGTLTSRNREKTAEAIAAFATEHGVEKIVVGNPINMNGSCGPRSEAAAALADRLRELTGLPVVLFDERCTTMLAHKILNETNVRGQKRKNTVDTLSAEIILQNYMDFCQNRPTP